MMPAPPGLAQSFPKPAPPGYAQHGAGWVEDDGWTVQSWEYTQLKFVETSSGDEYWVDWGTVYGPVVPAPIHWKEYRRQPPQSYAFKGLCPNEIARLYEVEHIGVQQGLLWCGLALSWYANL